MLWGAIACVLTPPLYAQTSTGNNTVNSRISVATGVLKTDPGTWIFANNDNDYDGFTEIKNGVVSIGSIADSGTNSAIGKGSSIILGQSGLNAGIGTLRFTGASGGSSNRTISIATGTTAPSTASGNGGIENTVAGQTLPLSGGISATSTAGATFTVTGAGNFVVSGNVTTTGRAVIKSGTGTTTLSGTNAYTGTTTVNAGTLLINGDQSTATGNVSAAGGATLGGSGSGCPRPAGVTATGRSAGRRR